MERAVYQQTPQALGIEEYLEQVVYGPYLARQASAVPVAPEGGGGDEAGEEVPDAD